MQGMNDFGPLFRWTTRLLLAGLLGFAMTSTTACSLFMGVEQEVEAPGPPDGVDEGEGLDSGEAPDDADESADEASVDEAIDREGDKKPSNGPVTRPTLDEEALGNMTYIYNDMPVTLENGIFQEKPDETAATFITNLSVYKTAFGDLTNDGLDDAAVILVDDPGGSGTFLSLYSVIDQGSALTSTAGSGLGDRTKIEKLWIENGQVMLDVIRHGPDDPMCCPTEAATLVYVVQNGNLVEVATE
jgi:hypothetical protein